MKVAGTSGSVDGAKRGASSAPRGQYRRPTPARSRTSIRRVVFQACRTRSGLAGAIVVGLIVAGAVVGPTLAPYSPDASLAVPLSQPSLSHPLGTDVLGRDVFSRLLAGGWELLALSAAATLVGVVLGAGLGVAASMFTGVVDDVIMRAVDVLLAFPQLVLALLLVSVLGASWWLLVIAVAIGHLPQVARVLRGASLPLLDRPYVESALALGVPKWRVAWREVVPNLSTTLMVEAGIRFTYSISLIASLSYLGFGLAPPAPSWGNMISENQVGLAVNPWAVVGPVLAIICLTVGVNLLTDAVAREALGVSELDVGVSEVSVDQVTVGAPEVP